MDMRPFSMAFRTCGGGKFSTISLVLIFKRAERRKPGFQRAIINFFRMELFIKPFIQALSPNFFDIGRTRAKGKAVQRVNDPLIVLHR